MIRSSPWRAFPQYLQIRSLDDLKADLRKLAKFYRNPKENIMSLLNQLATALSNGSVEIIERAVAN